MTTSITHSPSPPKQGEDHWKSLFVDKINKKITKCVSDRL